MTGSGNAPRSSDFAYRRERLLHHLGDVNPDQALANSDSYSMFLMRRRAAGAITAGLLPPSEPAPSGFADATEETKVARATAIAQVWLRLAAQGLTDLHRLLREVRVGSVVPATFQDPRVDRILREVRRRFAPILAGPRIDADDLLMIAGVLDRYQELSGLVAEPIASSAAATTSLTRASPSGLTLTVTRAFLAANERRRARILVEKLIELLPVSRIRLPLRVEYAAFAESVRDLHQ